MTGNGEDAHVVATKRQASDVMPNNLPHSRIHQHDDNGDDGDHSLTDNQSTPDGNVAQRVNLSRPTSGIIYGNVPEADASPTPNETRRRVI